MTEWQPISTAPKDGSMIWGNAPSWPHPMNMRFIDGEWVLVKMHFIDGEWDLYPLLGPLDRFIFCDDPTKWLPIERAGASTL